MIFSSFEYFTFFITFIFLMIAIKSKSIKKSLLLAASYYFYAYWDYRFVFLMFVMSLTNYLFGLKIEHSDILLNKKRWLALSLIFNLTILGFFKYYNFFIDSVNLVFSNLGLKLTSLEILLPIGISFITFEVLSYTVDIYRGNNKSAKSFWDLALLVAFFPHLIAGPILKPKEFLPQLDNEIIIKWHNLRFGLQIFLQGLVKKVLIADRLALFVDPVFNNPGYYSSPTIWLAVIAYAIQIYCDFSGYSDMAIGSAKCLGFDIPLNFNMPYISKSITEFWRRWHISLSTWLKEYLYISLGGNRKGYVRQYVNLLIVMLLGGLWHGASWNFVVWGGLHGLALAVHKVYCFYLRDIFYKNNVVYRLVSWLATFVFVCIAWVFFRSKDFSISVIIIKKLFYLISPAGINWFTTSLFIIIPILLILHYIGMKLNGYANFKLHSFKELLIFFFILFGLLFFVPTNSSQFIYFQF